MDMNLDTIKAMIEAVDASSLTEFSYKDETAKIYMSKKKDAPPAPPVMMMGGGMPPMSQGMGMMPGMPPAASPASAADAPAAETEKESAEDFIASPIVGTFYAAPAPDAEPFVKVGDLVKEGDTVCILEAMKLMNEIQAEYDCVIDQILVSNEQKVEYGQPLMRVTRV